MANCSWPSLCLVAIFIFSLQKTSAQQNEPTNDVNITTSDHNVSSIYLSAKDYFYKTLGVMGVHYNMKDGLPFILCSAWKEAQDAVWTEDCFPHEAQFFGKKLGCNAVYRLKDMDYINNITKDTDVPMEQLERVSGGCWHGPPLTHSQCEMEDTCMTSMKNVYDWKGVIFCCCTTHKCNERIRIIFNEKEFNKTKEEIEAQKDSGKLNSWVKLILMTLAIILFLFISLFLCIYKKRSFNRQKDKKKGTIYDVHQQGVSLLSPTSDEKIERSPPLPITTISIDAKKNRNMKSKIEIIKEVARGRFGRVNVARMVHDVTGETTTVAVKVFYDHKFFDIEDDIYRVDGLICHPNILHFYGSVIETEKREFYIVLEYLEKGCLEGYLEDHSFSALDALVFILSLMDGLAFLHAASKLPNGKYKTSVVHRDIKSRNILVRNERCAVIGDFGLAMVCGEGPNNSKHAQVGTHRYMSPEMLEGSTAQTIESLKKSDVYAASLIIWEVLNRTWAGGIDEIRKAELPYEYEMSITEDRKQLEYILKEAISRKRIRPFLRETLYTNQITSVLARTAVDMWDAETEARISAECAFNRLSEAKFLILGDAQSNIV